MKRSKRLFAMLGVLAIVCAATFAAMQVEQRKEQIKVSGQVVLEISADDVQSLKWDYDDVSLAFHKEETWLYDEDEAFPVDEEKVNALLEQFASFGVSFVIEEVTDYGVYGLDEPECTIVFTTAEESYTIKLGKFSNLDEERYVSIGDGNVYLAKNDPLEVFDVTLRDMIRHDETLSYRAATQIRFKGAEQYTITYEEDSADTYCAEDVYFTEQDGKKAVLDTERVEDYLEDMVTMRLTDYETYNVTDEELEAFGLNEPELVIEVDYTTESEDEGEATGTYALSISRDPAELAALKDAENDEEVSFTAYARVGQSQIVYRLEESDYRALRKASYDDLRHREVLTADFEEIVQMEISLDGAEYTLTAEEKDDERVWSCQGEEIEIDDLKKELCALAAADASDFTTQAAAGKREIGLTLRLDREEYEAITVELYRCDGENCLAVRNGESFALVPRSDTVDLIEAVNAIVLN